MLRRVLSFAILASFAVAQDVIDVTVSGIVYDPETITAAEGTTINFHFYPGDHSVAQSTYDNPCVPSGPDAIYSGFHNPPTGVAPMMFSMRVNHTNPIWLYCSRSLHCRDGMDMVINPPDPASGQTLDDYKKRARSAIEKSPPAVHGGVLVPNKIAPGGPEPEPGSESYAYPSTPYITRLARAHGIVMAIAVVIMFPLGALTMRLLRFRGVIWLHMAWQVVSLCLLTAGFGMGVTLANKLNTLYEDPARHHTILGTILFGLFWVQPFFGMLHHIVFLKKQKRTAVSYVHIWYGRALFITAIVNGGLGLALAKKVGNRTLGVKIAYSVVAGCVFVVYVCGASYGEWRRRADRKAKSEGDARPGE